MAMPSYMCLRSDNTVLPAYSGGDDNEYQRLLLLNNPDIGAPAGLMADVKLWLTCQYPVLMANIKGGACLADAPLHQLPDLRLLPVILQEKIFFSCSLASQRTLAASSRRFRPLWHMRRAALGSAGKQLSSASEAWCAEMMAEAADELACKIIRAHVVKKAIHRAPESHGSSALHMIVQGHLDQHELAYILQLQPDCLSTLGFRIGIKTLNHARWPVESSDMDDHGESLFMSFKLSCRRQAGLSDSELERLEKLFSGLPECMVVWKNDYLDFQDMSLACEPMWQCSTSPTALAAMRWDIPEEFEFLPEAADIFV